jgi:DNA-binding NarL/FixJ family response regulator
MRAQLLLQMPEISRALKRRDGATARRLLYAVVEDRQAADLALAHLGFPRLTPPEFVTMWAVACGLSVSEIAQRYHRAEETVKSHITNSALKLGWQTKSGGGGSRRAWAVAECYRQGIFDPESELIPLPPSAWP